MMIFTPDSLRTQIEAASGGRNTVLYDDKGYPSYMVRIPKFSYEDLGFSGNPFGTGVATMFLVNGVEKSEILIGQYQASVYDGRACSLPGKDPTTSINFDEARAACTSKGPGWHLMTRHEWAAIALWCVANGFEPTGNSDYGRSYNANQEVGRLVNSGTPGQDLDGSERTFTGSGPDTWRHDGGSAGIADLVGNIWEWVDCLKTVDGQVLCTPDNDYEAKEDNWEAQNTYFDTTGGSPKLQNSAGDGDYQTKNPWTSVSKASGYTESELMNRLMISPVDGLDVRGYIGVNPGGERLPLCGASWSFRSNAGLAALSLRDERSYRNSIRGFRPAFAF